MHNMVRVTPNLCRRVLVPTCCPAVLFSISPKQKNISVRKTHDVIILYKVHVRQCSLLEFA